MRAIPTGLVLQHLPWQAWAPTAANVRAHGLVLEFPMAAARQVIAATATAATTKLPLRLAEFMLPRLPLVSGVIASEASR